MKLKQVKKYYAGYILAFIFIAALGIRLYFAFQTPDFSSDEAYFSLRQIDEITSTGTPLYNDDLSYGGRLFMFPPLFHYILAFFNLFLPLGVVAKVLPNIFASSLIIITYYLAKNITQDKVAALYTAGIAGFIPIFFYKTVNSVSPYSLAVPLAAYAIYCFVKLHKEKKYAYFMLISVSCFTFVHASAVLLAIALVLYLVLLKTENIKEIPAEIEIVLFSSLLVIWFLLIIYKQALLSENIGIIFQNIPSQIIWKYFQNITVLGAIAKIGIVPFVYGIVTIYRYLFRRKTKFSYLFISFAITIGLLLLLKAIPISAGLMFLGMILTILYSMHIVHFKGFVKKTKLARLRPFMMVSLSFTLLMTQFLPTLVFANQQMALAPAENEVQAFRWIEENTHPASTILSIIENGHKITYLAKRKNVMDSNFLNAGDTDKIFEDIKTIYTTQYKTLAMEALDKYSIDYIYFSQDVKAEFGIEKLRYAVDDTRCFKPAYDVGEGKAKITIYKVLCRIEESKISDRK